jgi:hypothetical protein
MNPQDQPQNEEQVFNELMQNDQFDDSIDLQHQRDLRSEVLKTFDQRDHVKVESASRLVRAPQRPQIVGIAKLGYAIAIAVTLIGIISVAVYRMSVSVDRHIVDSQSIPAIDDSEFFASLDAVNAVREEDSPEMLFYAIAICQNDYEEKILLASNDR